NILGGLFSQFVDGSLVARSGTDPGTRPAICHAIREPRVCLATGEASGANLYGVLRFQHGQVRFRIEREGQIIFYGRGLPASGSDFGDSLPDVVGVTSIIRSSIIRLMATIASSICWSVIALMVPECWTSSSRGTSKTSILRKIAG